MAATIVTLAASVGTYTPVAATDSYLAIFKTPRVAAGDPTVYFRLDLMSPAPTVGYVLDIADTLGAISVDGGAGATAFSLSFGGNAGSPLQFINGRNTPAGNVTIGSSSSAYRGGVWRLRLVAIVSSVYYWSVAMIHDGTTTTLGAVDPVSQSTIASVLDASVVPTTGTFSDGTLGQLKRMLTRELVGHTKVNSGSKVVYKEDGTTVMHTSVLTDALGAPAALNATDKAAAT